MIFGLFILFAAHWCDEIRAANMGTDHKQIVGFGGLKNRFLKADNLNIK